MTWRVLTMVRRWRYWRRWQMTVPDPPPAADPVGEKRLIADDDLPDPATTAEGPELIVGAPLATRRPARLEYGAIGRRVPSTPTYTGLGRIVKQSLTKKSRTDLGRRMIGMCQLSGWQSTTLNPDMADVEKLTIVTARFGKIAAEDDPDALYAELIELSAATMGWAQGIARRQAKERKRRSREARKAARTARKAKGSKAT